MNIFTKNKIFKQRLRQKDTEFEILYNVSNQKQFNGVIQSKYLYVDDKIEESYELNISISDGTRHRIILKDKNHNPRLEVIIKNVILKKNIGKSTIAKLSREKEIDLKTFSSKDAAKEYVIDLMDRKIVNIRLRKRITKYLPSLWRMDFAINFRSSKDDIIPFLNNPETFNDEVFYQIELELIDKKVDIIRLRKSFYIIDDIVRACKNGDDDKALSLFLLNNYINISGRYFYKTPDFSILSARTETLTKKNMPLADKLLTDYVYSIKFDGFLTLLFIHDKFGIVGIGSLNQIVFRDDSDKTIMDEYNYSLFISEKVGDIFYLFDAIVVRGKPVHDKKLSKRLSYIIDLESLGIGYLKYSKRFTNPSKFKKYYKAMTKKVPQDGIIFTPKNISYFKAINYKWKPIEMQTIDFLVRVGKDRNMKLYVYANRSQIVAYKVPKKDVLEPSSDYSPILLIEEKLDKISEYLPEDIDGKIVEFNFEGGKWKPIKIRADKKVANNIKTAKSTIENLTNPILLDSLFE